VLGEVATHDQAPSGENPLRGELADSTSMRSDLPRVGSLTCSCRNVFGENLPRLQRIKKQYDPQVRLPRMQCQNGLLTSAGVRICSG
jgi:hypothetical protein